MPDLGAGEVLRNQAGELPDRADGPCREDQAFDTARHRDEPCGCSERIADRVDEPDRVAAGRLRDPCEEQVGVIGRDGDYGGIEDVRCRKQPSATETAGSVIADVADDSSGAAAAAPEPASKFEAVASAAA
jgi:hypothetical protein